MEYYIINRWKDGQQRFVTCRKCKKKFDLKDSDQYLEAIREFKERGEICYLCEYKLSKDGKD